eukprot:1142459-Pelagomonas_calceolata.AAC.5
MLSQGDPLRRKQKVFLQDASEMLAAFPNLPHFCCRTATYRQLLILLHGRAHLHEVGAAKGNSKKGLGVSSTDCGMQYTVSEYRYPAV